MGSPEKELNTRESLIGVALRVGGLCDLRGRAKGLSVCDSKAVISTKKSLFQDEMYKREKYV